MTTHFDAAREEEVLQEAATAAGHPPAERGDSLRKKQVQTTASGLQSNNLFV